ncbi:metallophosphoesterase family protein [Marininema halotolerans]|uniref:DNA repair exonuclease SbcCD nuclease subunit n=1 Tax=Marininema halotolerans TaxID=1155944 RepID=A0A1I6RR98_9BACL|nr:DNA repair exonuclease [Marininema halotolerans]SFS67140.1 DNA repair exonuclease SbcCD nuclease subunit [Marininema halotolerans]
MRDITFIHTADLHIDLPIRGLKGDERQLATRKEDYRKTFLRIVELCLERKVNFLFIAGDFLEYAKARRQTATWIINQFKKIPDTNILISPGNHDPFREDSYYRTLSWPENTHFFSDEWETIWFPDANLRVWGRGFTQFEEGVASYPVVQDETEERRIMILHGTFPMQEDSPYYPISEEKLTPLAMDYIALGHMHKAKDIELNNQRKTKVSYPGSPEALNWKETGERRVIFGQFTQEFLHIESIPIEQRRYCMDEILVTGCNTEVELRDRILEKIPPSEQNRCNCYRLILQGRRKIDFELSEDWLLLQLEEEGFFYVELVDETIPDYDLEKLAQVEGLTGVFLRRMQERLKEAKEEDREMLERALYQGLDALLASEVSRG